MKIAASVEPAPCMPALHCTRSTPALVDLFGEDTEGFARPDGNDRFSHLAMGLVVFVQRTYIHVARPAPRLLQTD